MAPTASQNDDMSALVADLARAHDVASEGLPSLSDEGEKVGFWEWIRSFLERVFGNSESEHSSVMLRWIQLIFETLIDHFHWFLLLAVFVTCWVILLKWLQRKSLGWRSAYERPILVSRTQSARDGLEIALRRGDYAEAARWQWRLFLEGRGADAAVTPSEFTHTVPGSDRLETALPEIYRIMFGPGTASENDFRRFALLLDEAFSHTSGATPL